MRLAIGFTTLALFLVAGCTPGAPPSAGSTRATATPRPSARSGTLASASPSGMAASPTENVSKDCLPPVVTSGFPLGEIYPGPTALPNLRPRAWELMGKTPPELEGESGAGILLVRARSGYDELWVVSADPHSNSDELTYSIFRPASRTWAQTAAPPSPWLFVDDQNRLWGTLASQDDDTAVFFRYDENGTYAPIIDRDRKLSNGLVISKNIRISSDGMFWFVFRDNADHTILYSLDPGSLEATAHLRGDFGQGLEIDEDSNVYLIEENRELIQYVPASGSTSRQELPDAPDYFGVGGSLLLDTRSRLWVADSVWFDLSEGDLYQQYQVIRSPIFIGFVSYTAHYRWWRPWLLLESRDGRIWYSSPRGNAWLDPQAGTWCLFSTYPGSIVEDSSGNLWTIVENDLYRLTIQQ